MGLKRIIETYEYIKHSWWIKETKSAQMTATAGFNLLPYPGFGTMAFMSFTLAAIDVGTTWFRIREKKIAYHSSMLLQGTIVVCYTRMLWFVIFSH